MRVFLDTNVLASGIATEQGLCAKIIQSIAEEHEFIIGEIILQELSRILPARFQLPPEKIEKAIALFREQKVIPIPKILPSISVRDPGDLLVLATASEAQADLLVTGAKDLLVIDKVGEMKIISPREFWNIIKA